MSRTTNTGELIGYSGRLWNSLTSQYNFICRKCSKLFTDKVVLRKHQFTHLTENKSTSATSFTFPLQHTKSRPINKNTTETSEKSFLISQGPKENEVIRRSTRTRTYYCSDKHAASQSSSGQLEPKPTSSFRALRSSDFNPILRNSHSSTNLLLNKDVCNSLSSRLNRQGGIVTSTNQSRPGGTITSKSQANRRCKTTPTFTFPQNIRRDSAPAISASDTNSSNMSVDKENSCNSSNTNTSDSNLDKDAEEYLSLIYPRLNNHSLCSDLSPTPLKPEEMESLANTVFLVPIRFTQRPGVVINKPPPLANGKVRKKSRWDVVTKEEPEVKDIQGLEGVGEVDRLLLDDCDSFQVIVEHDDELEYHVDILGLNGMECDGSTNGGYYGQDLSTHHIMVSGEDIKNMGLILQDDFSSSNSMNDLLVPSSHNQYSSSFDTDRIFADIDVGATETVDSRLQKMERSARRKKSSSTNKGRRKKNVTNNLLKTVLDKTLLVRMSKCDNHPLMPKFRNKEERSSSSASFPQTQTADDDIQVEVDSRAARGSNTKIESIKSPVNESRSKRKRKRSIPSDDDGPESPDAWNVVCESQIESDASGHPPLKLKIKRKRSAVQDEENKEMTFDSDLHGSNASCCPKTSLITPSSSVPAQEVMKAGSSSSFTNEAFEDKRKSKKNNGTSKKGADPSPQVHPAEKGTKKDERSSESAVPDTPMSPPPLRTRPVLSSASSSDSDTSSSKTTISSLEVTRYDSGYSDSSSHDEDAHVAVPIPPPPPMPPTPTFRSLGSLKMYMDYDADLSRSEKLQMDKDRKEIECRRALKDDQSASIPDTPTSPVSPDNIKEVAQPAVVKPQETVSSDNCSAINSTACVQETTFVKRIEPNYDFLKHYKIKKKSSATPVPSTKVNTVAVEDKTVPISTSTPVNKEEKAAADLEEEIQKKNEPVAVEVVADDKVISKDSTDIKLTSVENPPKLLKPTMPEITKPVGTEAASRGVSVADPEDLDDHSFELQLDMNFVPDYTPFSPPSEESSEPKTPVFSPLSDRGKDTVEIETVQQDTLEVIKQIKPIPVISAVELEQAAALSQPGPPPATTPKVEIFLSDPRLRKTVNRIYDRVNKDTIANNTEITWDQPSQSEFQHRTQPVGNCPIEKPLGYGRNIFVHESPPKRQQFQPNSYQPFPRTGNTENGHWNPTRTAAGFPQKYDRNNQQFRHFNRGFDRNSGRQSEQNLHNWRYRRGEPPPGYRQDRRSRSRSRERDRYQNSSKRRRQETSDDSSSSSSSSSPSSADSSPRRKTRSSTCSSGSIAKSQDISTKQPASSSQSKIKSRDTNTIDFFTGLCQICGSHCDFETASTHYWNGSKDKPYSCFTCYGTFSESKWKIHDAVCVDTSDKEPLGSAYLYEGDKLQSHDQHKLKEKRAFICSTCFNFMSIKDLEQ